VLLGCSIEVYFVKEVCIAGLCCRSVYGWAVLFGFVVYMYAVVLSSVVDVCIARLCCRGMYCWACVIEVCIAGLCCRSVYGWAVLFGFVVDMYAVVLGVCHRGVYCWVVLMRCVPIAGLC
jgi:hypothetical protein